MGIMDFLGHAAGELAALGKQVQRYKQDYIHMSNEQLFDELADLQGKSSTMALCRRMAIQQILKDRGVQR